MSQESLRKLTAECEVNPVLRDKIRKALDLDDFIKIALEAGFEVSAADWVQSQAEKAIDLSDAELEKAVGGTAGTLAIVTEVNNIVDNTVNNAPDKSGNWGSFAHTVC